MRRKLINFDVFERIEYMRRVEAIKNSNTSNYRNNTQELSNLYDKLTAYESNRNIHQNNFNKSETSYIDLESFTSQLDEKTLILQFLVSPKTNQVFFFSISKNWQKYSAGYFYPQKTLQIFHYQYQTYLSPTRLLSTKYAYCSTPSQ